MAISYQSSERSQRYGRSRIWLPPESTPLERQVTGIPYMWDGQPRHPDGHPQPVPGRHSRRTVNASSNAASGRVGTTERAVIGDQLREVAAWCELGPCIARYTDAGALGEADIAARAIAAGWCKDMFGRLICPGCQQRMPIWSATPVVPGVAGRPYWQRA